MRARSEQPINPYGTSLEEFLKLEMEMKEMKKQKAKGI